jgi:small-conductance mechanosensitive channel
MLYSKDFSLVNDNLEVFMDEINDFLTGVELVENSISLWIAALSTTIAVLLLLVIIKYVAVLRFSSAAKKRREGVSGMVAEVIGETRFIFILAVSIFLGSQLLTLPDQVSNLIRVTAVILFLFQAALWLLKLLHCILVNRSEKELADPAGSTMTMNAIELIAKIAIWSIALLLALDNIGFQVTALIASLGIGGIAIGLAVQNILGDLFASLSISLDKPFVIGDFINVGEFSGTVEYIGLKSTRVRSLSGEQVVFSNSDLLSSRIRNFKRMARRRMLFSFGVTYDTPPHKLDIIPKIVKDIIDIQEKATFDRAHFKEFGDFSLNFEVVYFMEVPEFNIMMDAQERINIELYKRLDSEGIGFAYPTQTVYVKNGTMGVKEETPQEAVS